MYKVPKKLVLHFLLIMALISCITPLYAEVTLPDGGFTKIAESANLLLLINKDNCGIIVRDKRNGYEWQSFVDETNYYDYQNANEHLRTGMKSVFSMNYTDLKQKERVSKTVESNTNSELTFSDIPNGCRIRFYFRSLGITVTFEISLENDTLKIYIPADGLVEEKENGIVGIELLPYFGAADRTVSGYMLYPDGSGAITRYENFNKRPANSVRGDFYIYSLSESASVMLPVFGVKNNDNAFLAAITEGAANSSVYVKPDGLLINLNRINFRFTYRSSYQIPMSNITINGVGNAKKLYTERYVNELMRLDREVRIFFLAGDNADYSGMASVYRGYLESEGVIKPVIEKNSTTPMHIEYFMGITETGMLFNSYIQMTSFEQARAITENLIINNVTNLQLMLTGWYKGGYKFYYKEPQPEGKLGGEKGLKDLAAFAAAYDVSVFLQNQYIFGNSGDTKLSVRKDAVYTPANLPVTFDNYSNNAKTTIFLTNPPSVAKLIKKALNNTYDSGLAINFIGHFAYDDYNKNNISTTAQTTAVWADILREVNEAGTPVAVDGGNLYVLGNASALYNIPASASGFYMTDESVPFYQMIVHGNIPYTSEIGNFSSDLRKQVLKWIEYGSVPYFELTYEDTHKLKDTDYPYLFSSKYDNWKDRIIETYDEFVNRIGVIYSSKMIFHQKLFEDVYKVIYDNGESVFLNYTDKEITVEGKTVGPVNYIVVEKDGGIR